MLPSCLVVRRYRPPVLSLLPSGFRVPPGLRPTSHGDQGSDPGVEVPFVRQAGVHLGVGDVGPGHAGGRVVRVVHIADGDVVVAVDVRKGVVDVAHLSPGDTSRQIHGLPVLAGAPAGEVPHHPSRMPFAHHLAALVVVDQAVGRADVLRRLHTVRAALGLVTAGGGGDGPLRIGRNHGLGVGWGSGAVPQGLYEQVVLGSAPVEDGAPQPRPHVGEFHGVAQEGTSRQINQV